MLSCIRIIIRDNGEIQRWQKGSSFLNHLYSRKTRIDLNIRVNNRTRTHMCAYTSLRYMKRVYVIFDAYTCVFIRYTLCVWNIKYTYNVQYVHVCMYIKYIIYIIHYILYIR